MNLKTHLNAGYQFAESVLKNCSVLTSTNGRTDTLIGLCWSDKNRLPKTSTLKIPSGYSGQIQNCGQVLKIQCV
ncbi:MAG: hypothetical protein NTZ74_00430 [Chloroflexi bacterium]|nr:hypothetical protein [Chloroflexota bacterium]